MSLGAFEMVVGLALMVFAAVGLVLVNRINDLQNEVSLLNHPFLGADDSAKFYEDEQDEA